MQIYLYQLRKEKGITQKELAQKLGIFEIMLQRLEDALQKLSTV